MDVGCYCVSGSRLLAGEPERSPPRRGIGPTGTDWVFAGTLRFPGDVLAHLRLRHRAADRDELEAIGREGSLFLDDPWHCNEPVIELRRDEGVERIELEPGRLVPARAREPERRDPRRGAAAPRARGRARRRRGRWRRCTPRRRAASR